MLFRLIVAAVVFASVGCDKLFGLQDVTGDDGIDAAPIGDALILGPWGQPEYVGSDLLQGGDDPTLTEDMLELYFNKSGDIYVITRADLGSPWGPPTLVVELSTSADETTPDVSLDGLTMLLSSTRTGTSGGEDIWIAKRVQRTDVWGPPMRISELATNRDETDASTDRSQLFLVMTFFPLSMPSDILMSTRQSKTDPWSGALSIIDVNTSNQAESGGFLSADALTLYFTSNRSGNYDIYESHRATTHDTFGSPTKISAIATAYQEEDPWVSADERTMYFTLDSGSTVSLWTSTR